MKFTVTLMIAGLSAFVSAQAPLWAQCGGQGHTGPTSCVSGACCVRSNEWYSQCVPCTNNPPNPEPSNPGNPQPSNPPTPPSNGGMTTTLPRSAGVSATSAAIPVKGKYDGGMKRFEREPRSCQEQSETGEKDAMFILEDGATLSNVIIGASSAEGVHCRGTCTLENVWWSDVCEDAATFKQSGGTSYVRGGGAFKASDKIFQFNGKGTVSVSNFYANDYGKLVRSCGTCGGSTNQRHVLVNNVMATNGGTLCGININNGDTCRVTNSCQNKSNWCELYEGTTKVGTKPDGKHCTESSNRSNC
ncbi:putative pectate lyase E [Paramyrothecium foliicola]|nr:putative pectate lyase E [Paramyrothecium foliicola]